MGVPLDSMHACMMQVRDITARFTSWSMHGGTSHFWGIYHPSWSPPDLLNLPKKRSLLYIFLLFFFFLLCSNALQFLSDFLQLLWWCLTFFPLTQPCRSMLGSLVEKEHTVRVDQSIIQQRLIGMQIARYYLSRPTACMSAIIAHIVVFPKAAGKLHCIIIRSKTKQNEEEHTTTTLLCESRNAGARRRRILLCLKKKKRRRKKKRSLSTGSLKKKR